MIHIDSDESVSKEDLETMLLHNTPLIPII